MFLGESEITLLALIREGYVDAEIAVRLGVPTVQVQARVAALYRKTGMSDRVGLRGWLAPEGPSETAPQPDMLAPVARQPFPARASALLAIAAVGAVAVLGWLALRNNAPDVPSAPPPRVAVAAGTTVPVHVPGTTSDPPVNGVAVREVVFAGIEPVPDNVAITVLRGSAQNNGTSIERVQFNGDVGLVAVLFQAPAGMRILDAIAMPGGESLAVAVCAGCSGTKARPGGATVDYSRSDDGGLSWQAMGTTTMPAGESLPQLVAMTANGLVLQARNPAAAHIRLVGGGPLCVRTGAVAVAQWAGFVVAFEDSASHQFTACDGRSLFAHDVPRGSVFESVRGFEGAVGASWVTFGERGGKTHFLAVLRTSGPGSTALRVPDETRIAGFITPTLAIGDMRTDPDTGTITPVLLDLDAGTFSFLVAPLYAEPPSSRLIEVPIFDKSPVTIEVLSVAPGK